MSALFWHTFCGHGENFTTWKNGDFGHCFEQIVVICPSYVILAIFSAYYIAAAKHNSRGAFLPLPWYVKYRFLCTLLLCVLAVVQVVLTRILNQKKVSYADIVTSCILSCSWLVHSIYLYRLKYLFWSSWRGATPMVLIYLLSLISLAAQLHTNIVQRLNSSPSHNSVEEFSVYVSAFLQVSYVFTLLPGGERVTLVDDDVYYRAINENVDESSSLLEGARSTYRSISQRPETAITAEYDVNCVSRLTFHWVRQLLVKGAKKSIKSANDLFLLPVRLSTLNLYVKFTHILTGKLDNRFQRRESYSSRSSVSSSINSIPDVQFSNTDTRHMFLDDTESEPISLLKALNKAFGAEYYLLGVLKLLADCFGFAGPILLNLLVSYIETKSEKEENGYLFATGLFLSTLLGAFCSTQFDYNCNVVGLKIRTAIITTIYRKSLSVSNVSVGKFTSGQIINFMSTDTDRIVNFCPSFHAVWSLPFQIGVSLYLLHQQVGLAFLAGLGFALILIPINRWLAKKIGQLSTAMMEQKDNRVKVMNEVLFGMRVVKFYAWEDHFESKINTLRDAELKSLKGRKYLDAMCVYFWATTPVLISILTFTTYSLMGNQLTAAKVFTSLSLFLMLISPLNAFPWVLNGLVESWVSLKRVQAFIALKDFDLEQYYSSNAVLPSDSALHIRDAEFSWKDTDTISQPKKRKLSQEPGRTRSSSQKSDGTGTLSRKRAPSQEPLVNDTHGEHKNQRPSVNESGDRVSSEEQDNVAVSKVQGTTLSLVDICMHVTKGQFVGVIGKVGSGKSSLLSCILGEMHRVRGHIRVNDLELGFAVATQEPWIQHATIKDNILFGRQFNSRKYERVIDACALMEDLKTLPAGDLTEVGENGVTLSGGQKARVALARAVYQNKDVFLLDDPLSAVDAHVAQHLYQKCIMGLLWGKTRILCTHHTKYLVNADQIILMKDGKIVKTGLPSEILDTVELTSLGTIEEQDCKSQDQESPLATDAGTLVEEEEKETGVVKLGIYKSYWKAVGGCLAPSVLTALFFMQASRNINDWWLSYWVSHSEKPGQLVSNHSKSAFLMYEDHFENQHSYISSSVHNMTTARDNIMYYLTIYGCLAGANSIFTLFRAFLFAYGGICAAQTIHRKLLSNILKAPVSFFDVTPIGRIVNRFSSDVFSIDDSLPFIMNIFLAQIYGILGTIVITCYGLPWFAVLLLPLGLLYYKIQNYYRHTSREIKRISSVTLSPIYAHFSETISGMTTIRAMREQDRFQKENLDKLDINQRAQFSAQAVASWLSFHLQMLGVAMVTGIAFIAVLEHHFQSVNPGLVGLAISYALSVTNLLSGVVTSFAETEKQMVSVERAQQYIDDVPNERLDGSLLPPPYWPLQGSIVFRHVRLKYRSNLTDALNKVSFEVEPAEKVGIVGRTGSGKSSLFLALFRMVEIYKGNIFVDGIDLIHLDLKDIRSRIAIIPQDPFLFSGTVRENLDPTHAYTDSELWSVLEKCHLKDVVQRLEGLHGDVAERGRHFSVGQRQLVCLARALLTRAKILCIDEATASVDMETDMLIQQTIHSEFVDSTVLTIAHRINTIMDSDRVLVMSEGKVAEFAAPGRLLQSHDSLFYKLVHGQSI
ncbi:ATP-binding cassette sub-family C member 10-like [Mercenaria mercenaria]|uniref:ATP-binding cassette sub-family C member 10-like n=1 Tax=Mercenaria mercenaria TaxID=6596 RepID=UPI00234F019B|nr:ATP-binding cassette sub-family C member 10-like [Mercenaria mercenaria]